MIINYTEIEDIKTYNNHLDKIYKESFFFDIETSGLSHKFSSIISITVLLYKENKYQICQLFCEHKIDEEEMIKYFKELIKGKKYIVTYNGNTFDIPFMTCKAQLYDIELNLNELIKIDLYNDMRVLRKKIEIDNLKLKSVEKYFDIRRCDTFSGEEIIILYEAYKIDPKKEFSQLILQHNFEDVFNLPILFNEILKLYDEIIALNNIILKINYDNFSIKKNTLIMAINIITNLAVKHTHRSFHYDLLVDTNSQILNIKIPVNHFKNEEITSFYYLKNEDFNLKKYTIIEGIKKNLIPIQFNDTKFNQNITRIIKNILNSIF